MGTSPKGFIRTGAHEGSCKNRGAICFQSRTVSMYHRIGYGLWTFNRLKSWFSFFFLLSTTAKNYIQSNLVTRNVLIRNKLVISNHFSWPIVNLLHKDKEHLALRNNYRVTKKFLITKFEWTYLLPTNKIDNFQISAWICLFFFCSWNNAYKMPILSVKKF